ncbi:cytochrome d ubiquinol oxidase subunit II [Sphaerisporangium corydalis]|uniref:Cytochrome d ubiquinol oxidase subunit II n=1 Tax=Sphaerisporangium corydalis TaxID=1441875 RepID=A0ABV9E844_9ACTN|nr:cytochrome d ubiquinol oxidase subunit II [Sphaerisporangium corydalis]
MENLAVALLAFFAVGYFVLGGADIGTGMIMPFLGRDEHERRLVVAAVAPFFLGNEVWLVATIGILAGAFPVLEGTLLHALFPGFLALVAAWVVRDMGLWLRGRVDTRPWRALWDTAIVSGSWGLALSWGLILTAVLTGHAATGPASASGTAFTTETASVTDTAFTIGPASAAHAAFTTGPVAGTHAAFTTGPVAGTDVAFAIGPVAVLGMLAVVALFAAHGFAFAALRLSGTLRARARRLSGTAREGLPAALTAAAMAALCLGAGARLAPGRAVADPATLAFLVPPLLAVTPLLLAAQAWVWWLFRHRVTRPAYL